MCFQCLKSTNFAISSTYAIHGDQNNNKDMCYANNDHAGIEMVTWNRSTTTNTTYVKYHKMVITW